MSVLSLVPEDKLKDFQRKESLQSVYSSNSRLSLLQKRKRLNPLTGEMSQQSLSKGDKYVTQRVLSAKTHKVKQLQNQLADAHYHLQELSNENRVLRAMQKKHEIALSRYENSNAELPQVLNSHSEEMRVQQTKYKQLKQQYKEVTQKLKERDMQLQSLKDEHQHLLELTKDKNLQEREKLQAQVIDLSAKVQQQNETINTLQRRIALEAKNFRHQLQNEIMKHKDTRHDLDLAISNADKLSTIIEIKEKMLSNVASRREMRSPTRMPPQPRPTSKTNKEAKGSNDDKDHGDHATISRFCENSRNLASALSHDEETSSSAEPRSRYIRSRTNSNSTNSRSTPNQMRKSSKGSDDMIELAKTVQEGMSELAIFDEEIDFKNTTQEEAQKKIDAMKKDLLNKIKNNEDPHERKPHLRKMSNEESIEEDIDEIDERPKSRGRKNSSVSFYEDMTVEETTTTVTFSNYKHGDEIDTVRPKREGSNLEKRLSGKPMEKYCNEIIHDIEKSSNAIDKHVRELNHSRFESDKLVQQLQAVDKMNEFVNGGGDIPEETLTELNNNFKMLTDQVNDSLPIARKRSVSGRRSASKTNLFGDASMSNQDLLNDLLGKN